MNSVSKKNFTKIILYSFLVPDAIQFGINECTELGLKVSLSLGV